MLQSAFCLASLDLSFMVQANMDTVSYYPDIIKRDFFESVRNRERGVKLKSMPSRIDTWKDDNQDREYGMVMKKFLTVGYDPFRSQDFAKVMDTGFHAVVGNFPSFFLVSAVSVAIPRTLPFRFFQGQSGYKYHAGHCQRPASRGDWSPAGCRVFLGRAFQQPN